jgi:nitrite reductase (NADH) small subunit
MLSSVRDRGQAVLSEREPAAEVEAAWVDVCALDDILPNTGVCALLGGKQVAIFRVGEGAVHALSNFDPFSKAFVLSRGIVGDRNGVPKVASPIFKQSFDLLSGRCLDDATVSVGVYPVRLRRGRIEVCPTPRLDGRQEP